MNTRHENCRRNVLGGPGHEHAAKNTGDHGREGQQRRHQHTGDHAWQNQNLERVQPEHTHRVDFLLHLHGANRGGEG